MPIYEWIKTTMDSISDAFDTALVGQTVAKSMKAQNNQCFHFRIPCNFLKASRYTVPMNSIFSSDNPEKKLPGICKQCEKSNVAHSDIYKTIPHNLKTV